MSRFSVPGPSAIDELHDMFIASAEFRAAWREFLIRLQDEGQAARIGERRNFFEANKSLIRDSNVGRYKAVPDFIPRIPFTEERVRRYAEKHYAGRYTRLDIHFRGHFCYIDA